MVLPAEIYAIKGAVFVQGVWFIYKSSRAEKALKARQVTDASFGRPEVLLAYRLVMLAWAVFIGLCQLADKGPVVFCFFTVWNWWLLAVYFALGTAASARALRRRRAGATGSAAGSADALDHAVMAILHAEAAEAIAIDVITWTTLVPMLLSAPQSKAQIASWRRIMFSFESYNQHGFNAAMMLGELALGRLPFDLYAAGWLAIWNTLFGAWSTLFYVKTGRFIYPFLDAHKPHAWVGYTGLYVLHWAGIGVVAAVVAARERLVAAAERRRQSAAAAARRKLL